MNLTDESSNQIMVPAAGESRLLWYKQILRLGQYFHRSALTQGSFLELSMNR